MTRERDIERVLDAWFEPGPAEMPDRLFDDVLARVDRLPQRRPLPTLRFPAMNSPIRWLALAAAVLVVAIGGLALINRPDGDVGASQTPSASPSLADSPIPADLIGQWMGSHRPVSGILEGSGSSLFFEPGRTVVTASNQNNVQLLISVAAAAGPDRFRLESTGGRVTCPDGDVGEYSWSLSTGGRILTISKLNEDCATRADTIPGTWWKMDCPTEDDPCLGDVEPGHYASQFFDQFVPQDAYWQPRFGAMTYDVPAGWSNVADWPDEMVFAPQGAPENTAIFMRDEVVAHAQADQCASTVEPGVGRTAAELSDWLLTLPGFKPTSKVPVSIGGLSGFSLDLEVSPDWTAACPYSDGNPMVSTLTDVDPGDGFDWNVGAGSKARYYFLDLGDGRALWIGIEAPTVAGYDAFVDQATAIVESFVFTR